LNRGGAPIGEGRKKKALELKFGEHQLNSPAREPVEGPKRCQEKNNQKEKRTHRKHVRLWGKAKRQRVAHRSFEKQEGLEMGKEASGVVLEKEG